MIRLDQQSLRALASPVRLDILKALAERNHTISELGSRMNKAGPTIREHVNALERAHLVLRKDTGHKWKYYELTPTGRSILTEERTFSLDLALFIIGGAGLAYTIYTYFSSGPFTNDLFAVDNLAQESALALTASAPSTPHTSLLIIAVLFALLLLTLTLRRIFPSQKQAFK